MPQPYNPWGTPIFPNGAAFGIGSPAEDAQRAPNLLDNLLSKIAGAAGRAFMAPGQALQSTEPIPTEQMIKPAADMAGMTTLGAGAIPADLNALRMGIKAYHGSPHDFDRFDLSKIGTGEGAQAYGHENLDILKEALAEAKRIGNVDSARSLQQTIDAQSKQTSNYVMFDDKLIDILKKYGLGGFAAPPIFANAAGDNTK